MMECVISLITRILTRLKVIAFSYALPGAMGSPGSVVMIDKDSNVTQTNVFSKEIEKVIKDESILYMLRNSNNLLYSVVTKDRSYLDTGFGSSSIEGWRVAYLGMGNFLFVKDCYYEDLKSLSINKGIRTPYDLYINWVSLIKELLM